jgi:hypothetical protein
MSRRVSPSTYSAWLRRGQAVGVEVRLAAELDDAGGELVGVALLLDGVLQELGGGGVGVHARGHVVVALVAEHAHELGRQGLVEQAEDRLAVACVARVTAPCSMCWRARSRRVLMSVRKGLSAMGRPGPEHRRGLRLSTRGAVGVDRAFGKFRPLRAIW